MTERCECCGSEVRCPWGGCRFVHYCEYCKEILPHWSDRTSIREEPEKFKESSFGFPCWVKGPEGGIYYARHGQDSHSKVLIGHNEIRDVWNPKVLRDYRPLPDFPESEEEGVWKVDEIYDKDSEPSREEHRKALGKP